MKPQKSWLLIIISVVIVITLVIIGTNLSRNAKQKNTAESVTVATQGDELDEINIKIPGTDKGSYWDLNVAKLTKVQDVGNLVNLQGDYIQNKQVLYTIKANNGRFNWRTRQFEVAGAVRFQTADGKELLAQRIRWEPAKNRLLAERQVVLKNKNLVLSTESIDTNLNLDQAKLLGMTKVTYRR